MAQLDIDEVMARLLVTEGFESIEEIAYIDPSELSNLEGFSPELATELQNRALEAHTKENQRLTEVWNSLGGTPELKELADLSLPAMIELAEKEIKTVQDLADLSGEELFESITCIPFSHEKANDLVMKAREALDHT